MAATLPAPLWIHPTACSGVTPHGRPPERRVVAPWADRAVLGARPRRGLADAGPAGGHHRVAGDRCRSRRSRSTASASCGSNEWDPVQEKYGGLVMIYGTLMTSFIALLIAVPVSFGIALFLTELSPAWLKRPLGTAIELLAAVPSIVYGMWGLLVFGPILADLCAAAAAGACSAACRCSVRWCRGRRWASASCRPASSWRSWSSRSSPR